MIMILTIITLVFILLTLFVVSKELYLQSSKLVYIAPGYRVGLHTIEEDTPAILLDAYIKECKNFFGKKETYLFCNGRKYKAAKLPAKPVKYAVSHLGPDDGYQAFGNGGYYCTNNMDDPGIRVIIPKGTKTLIHYDYENGITYYYATTIKIC